MQCPNCRKIEKGQWLYANGSRPFPEFSMDDWAYDEDLYDLSYTEMCPCLNMPLLSLNMLLFVFKTQGVATTVKANLRLCG
ncbi:hypothetical protein LguiB_006183 [Lonicera macranthoides]